MGCVFTRYCGSGQNGPAHCTQEEKLTSITVVLAPTTDLHLHLLLHGLLGVWVRGRPLRGVSLWIFHCTEKMNMIPFILMTASLIMYLADIMSMHMPHRVASSHQGTTGPDSHRHIRPHRDK